MSVSGAVYTCGAGTDGQLGLGDTQERLAPTLVDVLRCCGVVEVAAGASHVLARTVDGALLGWGSARDGVLGADIQCVMRDSRCD